MDAFFASVEQRDHPAYRNRSVIVGGRPGGRGVVAAASYEARAFGIHSAMPSTKAYRLCPDAIFVNPRFDVYRDVSHTIRQIFHRYTDQVEPLSLDEAYLDLSHEKEKPRSATRIAKLIRKAIHLETGLTASAGVSYNKFLAKIASDQRKPDGIYVITPERAPSFLENLDIGDFYGIGKATRTHMERLGIFNGKDLKEWEELDLVREFGKSGHHYYRIVRGIDDREVSSRRIRKSVGKERTFREDLDSIELIQSELTQLAEQVASQLENLRTAGRTITLKVRYENFETVTRRKTLSSPVDQPSDILQIALQLLNETEAALRPVRLLGISLSSLDLSDPSLGEQLEFPFLWE